MKRHILLALVSGALIVVLPALAQTPSAGQPPAPGAAPEQKQAPPAPKPPDSDDGISNTAATCRNAAACLPGESVRVAAAGPALAKTVAVTLRPSNTTDAPVSSDAKWDGKTLLVTIPQDAPDGRYSLCVKPCPADKPDYSEFSPSQIVVQRPTITAVSPAAAFAEKNGDNIVIILGTGFWYGKSEIKPAHVGIDPDDKRVQLRFNAIGTPNRCVGKGCYELKVDSDRQITLTFHKLDSSYYKGKMNFVVSVDGVDTDPATLTLINTTQSTPITVAVVGFTLILLLIYFLLRSGEHATKQTMGGKTYWLSTLFFDVQTNSYSLSKCQFYAWTAAAVIGYLFLAVSKSFVQGSAIFPDIPPGLPGILVASVGTVVLSSGISSAKGDKGAGNQGPNLSDFIATGGVVAADRLQFAIWTIVGIGTFLAIVFQSDPRNINDLPAIPAGFLQLMGISSAGYIAGKVARKAGPTISALALSSTDSGALRFQVTGSGLSRSAIFAIDDQTIFPDIVLGKDEQKGPPEILQTDSTAGDQDFARVLAFSIAKPPSAWFGKGHTFTITNPDAQKATVPYEVFIGTSAEAQTDTTKTPPETRLTISGKSFDSTLAVQYNPTGVATPTEITATPTVNETTYTVTIPSLTAAAGDTVTLSCPSGVKQTLQVTVKAPAASV